MKSLGNKMLSENEPVAIKRRDEYLVGLTVWTNDPFNKSIRILPLNKAKLLVRVDLGLDLSDVEFVSRDKLLHRAQ